MASTPPPALITAAGLVEDRMDALFSAECERWSKVDPRLVEAIEELSNLTRAGGKRLRAGFCYWSFVACAPDQPVEAAIDAAAACELLQAFALIHDDIMDNAETRRGRDTIHANHQRLIASRGWRGEPRRYGEGVAILIGDLGHVYADRTLGPVSVEARQIWDEMRIELNLGQYLDMRSSAASENDRKTAEQVLTFKSALYTIVRPLQLGASVAGRNDTGLHQSLERFGHPVGTAFQLRDDLLGLLSTEEELGKPVGSDLREGKSTEILAIALERANPSQLKVLSQVGREDLTGAEVEKLLSVLHETGSIKVIETRIEQLVAEAEIAVERLPFTTTHQRLLIDLGRFAAERTY